MYFYVNGCSLTLGASFGYCDKHSQNKISWAKQLEKEFNCEVINDALSCSSNERIVRTTVEYVKNNYNTKDEMFIWICWSGPDRFEFFVNDPIDIDIINKMPWAGKEQLYDGIILNITNYWRDRLINKNLNDLYHHEFQTYIDMLKNTNNFINYKFDNSCHELNNNKFIQQIILLQSFLENHNIKYGMSFAIDNLNQDYLVNKKTFFDFNGNMMKIIEQNGFKKDPTRHFYPDGYEFYGQQIAKFIKENYSL
jgi:hypothetical protein